MIAASLQQKLLLSLEPGLSADALIEPTEQLAQQAEMNPQRLLETLLHSQQLGQYRVLARSGATRGDSWQHALVQLQGQWLLATSTPDRKQTFTDAEGSNQQPNDEALESANWYLLMPRQRAKASRLGKSPAERLVLSALFSRRRWVRDILIASLVVNLLAIATSIFAMQVYDRVVPTLAYATLTTLVAGMLIVIVLDWVLKTFRARTLDSVSCEVDRQVSQQVFDHLVSLRLDTRPRMLGTLAAQVSGLDSIRQFFSSTVVFGLIDLPFALVFIFFISIIGGPVAYVYLLLLPLALLLGLLTQARLRNLMHEQMLRSNERQGLLVDAIRGTETLRACHADWRVKREWQEVTRSVSRFNIQQKAVNNLATVTTGSLSTLAYVAAIVVGVTQIEAGNLTMGALIACSILGGRVIAPIAQGIQYLAQWQNVRQSLDMLNHVLELDTERDLEQNLLRPEQNADTIRLERASFCYPETSSNQLEIDQLEFKAGDRVLLVGKVGSGKSTLMKLLAGSYRPSAGRVLLGGVDIWELDPAYLADQVGYLPQQAHLFKGTLRENLTLGKSVSDDRLISICAKLGIDQIAAAHPKGLDRPISEGGDGLSGGQRQLVTLARVLLQQPPILLLDEPTASFDQNTDQQALSVIGDALGDQGILVLSTHRLGLAAKLVNRVVWIEDGRIREDGPANQVMPRLRGRPGARPNPPPAAGQAALPGGLQIPAGFKPSKDPGEPGNDS